MRWVFWTLAVTALLTFGCERRDTETGGGTVDAMPRLDSDTAMQQHDTGRRGDTGWSPSDTTSVR